MNTKHPFEQLWEFQEAFDLNRSRVPALPSKEERKLRRKLLTEEYNEYLEAELDNDLVEIADALGDMMYIILGTAVSYGIPLDEIFDEIHASNMTKLGPEGKPIRREDGKILKPATFRKPDLKSIIERHINKG